MVVAGTGKIDFGPAWAAAGALATVPASARTPVAAPVVRMVLRLTSFIVLSLVGVSCSGAVFTAFSLKLHSTYALLHRNEPHHVSLRRTGISTARVHIACFKGKDHVD